MMTVGDQARYEFEYELTLEEYIDFNIYTGVEAARARKVLNRRRLLHALIVAFAIVMAGLHAHRAGIDAARHSTSFLLYLYVALFSTIMLILLSTPALRKRARRMAVKFSQREESAYSKSAVLAFYESHIYEKSELKEERIQYDKISRCHIGADAVYIFTTAVNAYILPKRVLGQTEGAFIAFLREKLPSGCFE